MLLMALLCSIDAFAQTRYYPEGDGIVCESTLEECLQGKSGTNRFTRALYGGHTDWRLETSDRPVFAVVKKNHHRNIRFRVNGIALDSTEYCKATYVNGMRIYSLKDSRWGTDAELALQVVALPDRKGQQGGDETPGEGAVFLFEDRHFDTKAHFEARVCAIRYPKLHRNGDIGVDWADAFEHDLDEAELVTKEWDGGKESFLVIDSVNKVADLSDEQARLLFMNAVIHNGRLASRLQFHTPDPYINTLGAALSFAADGDWDGKTWLHGCVGWRMPLAGWRAAYVGDVLGWNDRQLSHFNAYAKSQVTEVDPVIPHPSQDPKMNMARAEKRWGTQMYSNGYICRNPERNDQMHHYDMNLNYMDELLWHFQYDADTAYMRKMWPLIKSHLAWEKRNYDPDGDHLYDAYCCIWASDALYYNGGAVTHSSAYNYRGNKLAARIAEIIGEDSKPYRDEADAILEAMNQRLWLKEKGVWAEYQDAMGLKRLHESPAVWSVYTPIDCGACTPEQAYKATDWVMSHIPHIRVADTGYRTIATSNWMPYSWSINNVAAAEVMHTALAFFEAGHSSWGYELLMGNVMDQMYLGKCPGNFGQISKYDAARGECYRDFGDCIGISSRTLIQGLFGIVPQALDGVCYIRPGFPSSWDSVSVKTPYLEYKFTRKGGVERYEITQHFRQPLKIVVRQNVDRWVYRDTEGTNGQHQVIECKMPEKVLRFVDSQVKEKPILGLETPEITQRRSAEGRLLPSGRKNRPYCVNFDKQFNACVDDIFKNQYLSPRPQTTTLQIPVQGIGEWCHPQLTADINDSVFRSMIVRDNIVVAGIPFRTLRQGRNIVYTSLWDNYPDSVTIPLKGSASVAHLLMAGSTNHMQSRIDNGLVIVAYTDGSTDTLTLRNPDNWCPIEQDYYVDGKAFYAATPRPLRVCLNLLSPDGQPLVSRDLGAELGLKGAADRYIPGGAAQILSMPLNSHKRLKSLTLRTLSNDVVIGLMAVTLQDTSVSYSRQLQEVIVTESRRQHQVTSTAPLHILDREQMLTLGVTDMADALHRLPGVTLRDYGGAGGLKTVSVRGFGAKHTGVSYDGVMLSDCQSGEIDLSRYSLDHVDQLSLVVGDNDDIFIPARNASASAVLNIQTLGIPAGDRRPHLTTQLKVGSFGYVSPFVRYEQNLSDRFALSVLGEYTYAENDYPFTIKNVNETVNDRRTNSLMNSAHGELNFVWNTDVFNRFSGKVYYYDNDRQLPGQVHYYTNLNKETLRDRNFFAQLQYLTHNRSGWSLKCQAKYNWNASIYQDPLSPNSFNDASYWQREAYATAALLYTPSEHWAFDYSADYAFNNLNGSATRTIGTRPFRHTILQSATAKYRDSRLTALARLLYSLYLNDAKDGEGARNMRRLSPSLSLSYRLLEDRSLFLRASYKNIFRAPTFNESYYFHFGSTDLLPESTDQYNIGVTGRWNLDATKLQLTLDGYYNHVKDMIVAVPYNMFVWTCINVGKVRVLGAEIAANGQWPFAKGHKLELSGNYSYQQAENRTNPDSPYYGNQIAYIPRHTGSLALGWENPWVSLSLHGYGVSSRWANNQHYDDTRIDGYCDLGLTAWRTFKWGDQQLEARVDVKNLFSEQYEIVRFYPMPGRSWQLSVSYQL